MCCFSFNYKYPAACIPLYSVSHLRGYTLNRIRMNQTLQLAFIRLSSVLVLCVCCVFFPLFELMRNLPPRNLDIYWK